MNLSENNWNILVLISNDWQANLDTEWKFTRTKLWLCWIHKKGVLPPPFNVLYVLLPLIWVVKRLVTVCCSRSLVSKITASSY